MPHLVIMAAGTGGHIIPGIAVAREVQRRGWTVSWLGTQSGMENRLVPPAGIPLDTLAFNGLRGKGWLHTLTGGLRLLKACWDSAAILRRRGADAVLGMGGYVCFPGGLMAGLLRKPLVLVNADAALLLSNKALLRVAQKVAFGFDGTAAQIKQGVVTGNPVRAEIEALPAPGQRFADRSGPLACWWWVAAWVHKCSTKLYRPRWRCCRPASAPASCTRPAAPSLTQCAAHTPRPASAPRCCPSSTTWPSAWPIAT